jgi:hypothetical protein
MEVLNESINSNENDTNDKRAKRRGRPQDEIWSKFDKIGDKSYRCKHCFYKKQKLMGITTL